jgi:hypothetical protein
MSTPEQHFDAARKFQEFYDNTLRKIGMRAPQPVLGETVNNYRRETLRTIKKTFLPSNHELYRIQFRGLPADVLNPFETQLLSAAVVEANNPIHVPVGELRKIEELDEFGKLKTIRWIGQESFVKQMMRPGRRVVSFRTDHGYVDASGRGLR